MCVIFKKKRVSILVHTLSPVSNSCANSVVCFCVRYHAVLSKLNSLPICPQGPWTIFIYALHCKYTKPHVFPSYPLFWKEAIDPTEIQTFMTYNSCRSGSINSVMDPATPILRPKFSLLSRLHPLTQIPDLHLKLLMRAGGGGGGSGHLYLLWKKNGIVNMKNYLCF